MIPLGILAASRVRSGGLQLNYMGHREWQSTAATQTYTYIPIGEPDPTRHVVVVWTNTTLSNLSTAVKGTLRAGFVNLPTTLDIAANIGGSWKGQLLVSRAHVPDGTTINFLAEYGQPPRHGMLFIYTLTGASAVAVAGTSSNSAPFGDHQLTLAPQTGPAVLLGIYSPTSTTVASVSGVTTDWNASHTILAHPWYVIGHSNTRPSSINTSITGDGTINPVRLAVAYQPA